MSVARARSLRRRSPLNERKLWDHLRDRRLEGVKFRRQFPIGGFVADFACLEHRLVVELDGPFHDAEADGLRDRSLTLHGYRVVRFKNALVEGWIDRVLDLIRIEIGMAPVTKGPLQDQGDQPRLNWSPGPAS